MPNRALAYIESGWLGLSPQSCGWALEGLSPNGYAACMSETVPVSVEPPEPTPEQLGALQVVKAELTLG